MPESIVFFPWTKRVYDVKKPENPVPCTVRILAFSYKSLGDSCSSNGIPIRPKPDLPGWVVKDHVTNASSTASNRVDAEELLCRWLKSYQSIGLRSAFHKPETVPIISGHAVRSGGVPPRSRPFLNLACTRVESP